MAHFKFCKFSICLLRWNLRIWDCVCLKVRLITSFWMLLGGGRLGWISWVQRRTRTTHWLLSTVWDSFLRMSLETHHHNFDPLRRGMAPPLWYPKRYNLDGNLEDTAHTILYAPSAISVHGGVSPDRPRTQALQSGAEISSDWPPRPSAWAERKKRNTLT